MTTSTPSSSHWHSVTPTTRPLTLTILELTPLALTLSLTLASNSSLPYPGVSTSSNSSSSIHPPHTPTPHPVHSHHHHQSSNKHRKKTRHRRDSEEELTTAEHDDLSAEHFALVPGSWPTTVASTNFKDLLSHGVVVSVNGQPWSRIVAHVSDPDEDEGEEADEGDTDDQWEDDWDHAGDDGDSIINTAAEEISGVVTRRRRGRGGSLSGTREIERPIRRRRKKTDKDRAVVVVYGLNPGKEYEVELRVVGAVESEGVSNTVLIPPSPGSLHPRSRANSLRSRSRPRSRSNSVNTASPLSHDSPAQTDTPTPPIPTAILNPVDTQAAQLRHLIAAAHVEKDHLMAQMKEARRASQRAEAAIKVEIETLKRATEKAGAMDLRAKQKALALQEQVKQGWAGAEAAEAETLSVEGAMAALEARLEAYRSEVEGVRVEWRVVKEREDDMREREKRSRAEEDRKLVDTIAKVDKLKVKREKKDAERIELERRLVELEKEKEEAERRNDHRKNSWGEHRSLSAHPSLNNLAGHAQYAAGPAYRPRGVSNYHPRYPSAGAVRPNPGQSPTHPPGFYPQHPLPSTSPAFRPAKTVTPSPGNASRTTSSGVNVGAAPFHPSSAYTSQVFDTTLMPPQLQHRIYLPNVRPRPAPNFHPPPSVVAEQAQQQQQQAQAQAALSSSPPLLSPPAFPPLPSQSQAPSQNSASNKSSGPSLASIVTRAVLSPNSGALASQGITGSSARENTGMTRPSPPSSGRPLSFHQHSSHSPVTPISANSSSPTPGTSSSGSSNPPFPNQRVTFAPPPTGGSEGFPALSPVGPWASAISPTGAQGMVRTATPPVGWGSGMISSGVGRESPFGIGNGPSSGSGSDGKTSSRRGSGGA